MPVLSLVVNQESSQDSDHQESGSQTAQSRILGCFCDLDASANAPTQKLAGWRPARTMKAWMRHGVILTAIGVCRAGLEGARSEG